MELLFSGSDIGATDHSDHDTAVARSALCKVIAMASLVLAIANPAAGGLYSGPNDDPDNGFDAGVPGFVGPHGDGKARLTQSEGIFINPENRVNHLFCGWADEVVHYLPSPNVALGWSDHSMSLGPVKGEYFDIVSLGDLNANQMTNRINPGSITLSFFKPLQDKTGADLAVFENSIVSQGGSGIAGQPFAELAYVEISSDGEVFARFPSRFLTTEPVGSFGTIDASNIFGLAGKHANANGLSWGTPFDFAALKDDPAVISGQIKLNAITHVRVVDIAGNGAYRDTIGAPIYDAWETSVSGGFDLEAVGVIGRDTSFSEWQNLHGLPESSLGELADSDEDGRTDLLEYAAGHSPQSPDGFTDAQRFSMIGGLPALTVRRDERAVDLVLEIETSSDLLSWAVIARSTDGNPFQAVPPHAPQVTETRAPGPASVGVIREATIIARTGSARQGFMRLSVRHK